MESSRSFQSNPSSTSTKLTMESIKSNKHYFVYVLNGERVIGQNHNVGAIRIDIKDMNEMQNVSFHF
jgi:hypothetical protein